MAGEKSLIPVGRIEKAILSKKEADFLRSQIVTLEKRYNSQFKQVFDAIRQLMAPPEPKRRPTGFRTSNK